MSLKHKGVQGWAKGGERSAGFRVGMYGLRFYYNRWTQPADRSLDFFIK
jgi:hypothetical protein